MWRKIALPFVLGVAITLVSHSVRSEAASFSDSSGHWAKEAIETAVSKGYVDGYEDGTFRPDREVSRAEFVKMAATALKLPVSGKTEGADWYVPYANAAVNADVHLWSDYTSGDWNTPMTRQEMARMAVRAAGEKNEDAKKWMYLATSKGLIQGMDDTGRLGEEETTTRAQSVTIIERVLTVRSGGTLPTDKYAINRAELAWHKTNILTMMPQFFSKPERITDLQGNLLSEGWEADNMFVATPDGLYRGEIDALIAVDLDDPNDPHRNLVDISSLKWQNINGRTLPPVSELRNAYLLINQSRVVFNHNTNLYANWDFVAMGMSGFVMDIEKQKQGILTTPHATTTKDFMEGTTPHIFVVPKIAETDGYVSISIKSSAFAGNETYRKTLLKSRTPNHIE